MKAAIFFGVWLTVGAAAAQSFETYCVSTGKYDVPVEVAKPARSGPFPPLPYIHARRGLEDEDRAHMRELA
jgi:carboxymethylenebutenolidase